MKTAAQQHGHTQAEAFFLMRYEGPGGRREWIWNSRDAITPAMVHAADDERVHMHHGNWHLDRYEPHFVPPVGARVFVDLTEEVARPLAEAYVAKCWDNPDLPMSEHPHFAELGRAGSVECFVKEWVSAWGGHSPHLTVVTPVLHEQFKARAEAMRLHAAQRRDVG